MLATRAPRGMVTENRNSLATERSGNVEGSLPIESYRKSRREAIAQVLHCAFEPESAVGHTLPGYKNECVQMHIFTYLFRVSNFHCRFGLLIFDAMVMQIATPDCAHFRNVSLTLRALTGDHERADDVDFGKP